MTARRVRAVIRPPKASRRASGPAAGRLGGACVVGAAGVG